MAAKRRNPDWDNIEDAAAKKRSGKNFVKPKSLNSGKIAAILSKQELVVQRLSTELSGKTPKYAPLGAREFVPYLAEDVTVQDIKNACVVHFKKIDDSVDFMTCDLLATERGPSCVTIDQIPNIGLIHIRFIKRSVANSVSSSVINRSYNVMQNRSHVLPSAILPSRQKVAKSLSLSAMMKMGQTINKTVTSTEIAVESFDYKYMSWSEVSNSKIKFFVNEEILGAGSFRNAYKVSSPFPMFKGEWVLKKYNDSAKKMITEDHKETLEQHTRKVVQMSVLASHFATKLSLANINAPKFSYLDCFYGVLDDSEIISLEPFLKGKFKKFMNNDGICRSTDPADPADDMVLQAECLAHFSFVKSEEKLLLTDIQGCGFKLTDPEIASSEIANEKEMLFCVGNFCKKAIKNFGMTHICNKYCKLVDLPMLKKEEFDSYDDTINFPDFISS